MKFILKHAPILLIFFLAFIIRTYHLETLPLALHRDEIMNGYVGRFILQNGIDLYGNKWPILYFNNFGDYPNVIPMYVSGLSTYLFGINIFAIRFPIALAGALSVFPLYFLALAVFKKKWVALFGALLLAITPWHVVLSRATAEGILAAFVFMTGLALMIYSFNTQRKVIYFLGILLLFSTYLLYPAYRIIVPLSLLPTFLLTNVSSWKKLNIAVLIVSICLTGYIAQTPWGMGRYEQTSIFAKGQIVEATTQQFSFVTGNQPIWLVRAFHNKVVVGSREVMHQYLSYFSGDFWFARGGQPPRYTIPDVGLTYYAVLILFMFVLLPQSLLKKAAISKNETGIYTKHGEGIFYYILWIVLITPFPAALTRDDVPNIHRTALLSILYIFPVMYGLSQLGSIQIKKMKVKFIYILAALLLVEVIYFARMYTVYSDRTQAIYRNDEIPHVIKYIDEHMKDYDMIYVPSQQQIALQYLFIHNNFSKDLADKFERGIYLKELGKAHFYQQDCPSELFVTDIQKNKRILIIDRIECPVPKNFRIQGTLANITDLPTHRILSK